jgi:GAF domain-containing protein
MTFPSLTHEYHRDKALRQYHILDTLPERAYDDITQLAAYICNVPISLICLADSRRQWIKSKFGFQINEVAQDISFCAYTILNQDLLIVNDAIQDKRFHNNPLVINEPKIRFYAGAPLVTPEGFAIGTLCVIDRQTRSLSVSQTMALKILARQAVQLLEFRRVLYMLEELLERNEFSADTIQFFLKRCCSSIWEPESI